MSSTATQQPAAPPSEVIFGIAKKMHLELEKLPLHTHAIVMNILRGMVEHRKVELDNQVQEAQIKAQEAAMADARKAHAEAQVKRDEQLAAEMIRANAAKTPRMSIVLNNDSDKTEDRQAEDLVATL